MSYDQTGSSFPIEVEHQCRIFTKNGKHFCFNCLTSEYNVNCGLCHKRINSKDNLGCWSGVIAVNGVYDADADHFGFQCRGCIEEKVNSRRSSIHKGYNDNKCRIAGCSQKAYYECMDLCLHHSKPCRGAYIGKKCNLALGSDEGDFCKLCENQNKSKQSEQLDFERYKQIQQKAQSWWSVLSP